MKNTFTTENFETLKNICNKIISLSNENIDGNLMISQLICLGENIKEFIENPIVKNSGLIKENITDINKSICSACLQKKEIYDMGLCEQCFNQHF